MSTNFLGQRSYKSGIFTTQSVYSSNENMPYISYSNMFTKYNVILNQHNLIDVCFSKTIYLFDSRRGSKST